MVKWKPITLDKKKVKEGVAKMQQALIEDAKREANRPSSLPKDWRSRILLH